MAFFHEILMLALKLLLHLYKLFISPFLGQHCRFHPSCSVYSVHAVEKHGLLKGLCLAFKRIMRCNPWYAGKDEPI